MLWITRDVAATSCRCQPHIHPQNTVEKGDESSASIWRVVRLLVPWQIAFPLAGGHPVQRAARDSEDRRGARAVPAGELQHLMDVALDHHVERQEPGGR